MRTSKLNITKVGDKAYGCRIYVCGNDEVIALRTVGSDPRGCGWREEVTQAVAEAMRVLDEADLNYTEVSDFRAYNGGPRRSLVEAEWYFGDVCEPEDPDSEIVWRSAKAAEIPAELFERVEAAIDAAGSKLCGEMQASVIERGSKDDRAAYEWAKANQGYAGTWQDWLALDADTRQEYEYGAAGSSRARTVIPA